MRRMWIHQDHAILDLENHVQRANLSQHATPRPRRRRGVVIDRDRSRIVRLRLRRGRHAARTERLVHRGGRTPVRGLNRHARITEDTRRRQVVNRQLQLGHRHARRRCHRRRHAAIKPHPRRRLDRQRLLQGADHPIAHFRGTTEADLLLGGMHIDIHRLGVDRDKEDQHGVSVARQQRMVPRTDRIAQ